MGATVLSVSSRALIDACARLGLDTRQILEAARLDPATVQDPDARIPVEQMQALWAKAYALAGDPNLALHAVEALPFGAYKVIDFLASQAPTPGEALAKVADYFPLINDAVRARATAGAETAAFAIEAPSHPSVLTRPYAEYALAAVFLRTRAGLGHAYPLLRVEFSHPAPADTSEHRRIFESEVRFGAEACRLVVTREMWDRPRTDGNPALFTVLDAHARMLLDRLPAADGIAPRVAEAIDAELAGGHPTLAAVARRLALSPRTLQRRLRAEGIVFNDLLDGMRFQAARTYLAHRDIAGAEVAHLLGFAEQSSFNRAFRRWSGQTPTAYRRSATA